MPEAKFLPDPRLAHRPRPRQGLFPRLTAHAESEMALILKNGYDYFTIRSRRCLMQRNMDLVRQILMRIESSSSGWAPDDFGIKSFSPEEIGYHAHIMMQEG